MPKISVIMPVYNGEKYLREAIDSILNQTLSDFEFIIINDASTDKTEEIIKSYTDNKIKYLKNENNLGVAGTLNRGLDTATGEYIARMDADDISLPLRFENQVKFMDKHRNIAVCGGAIECFGEGQNKKISAPYGQKVRIGFLISSSLFHRTVMMRRSIIEKEYYRYDNYFNKVEDFELWTRIIRKYKIDNLHCVLLKYRVHKNQVTQNYDNKYRLLLAEAKKNFLKSVGIELTDIEICAFNDYCLEKIDYDKQIKYLISALKKIIILNDKLNYFDRKCLRKNFSKIVLRSARLQKIYTKKDLIKMAGFVTSTEIQKDELKCLIKKVIGRK